MFVELVDWVIDRGGYVHKAVGWDDTTRTLTTHQTIAPNTVVLRIPAVFPNSEYSFPWPPTPPPANDNNTCIDNETITTPVTNSSFNKNNGNDDDKLEEDVVHPLLPHTVINGTKSRRENDKTKLYHSVQDLQLAWMLAQQPTTLQPYLNSLPAQIDLPRHHYHHNGAVSSSGGGGTTIPKQPQPVDQGETDVCGGGGGVGGDNVLRMLTGSSVESHIQKSSVGVVNDYNSIIGSSAPPKITTNSPTSTDMTETTITPHSSSPPSSSSTTNPPRRLPTFDEFSHAMAVVSSRAFSYTESSEHSSGDDANVGNAPRTSSVLVPVLDLCNHCRGLESRSKNLAYTFEASMLPKGSTEQHTAVVIVVVTTTTTVAAGDTFRVTYGAIGNAVLLLNYGFCIPNNIEPDGSSNDILEFYPHNSIISCSDDDTIANLQDPTTSRVILLQTGPKAYTYSCFMTAIQSFYPVLVVTGEDDDDDDDDNHGTANCIGHDYMDDLHVTDFDENGDDDDDDESVDLYTTGTARNDAEVDEIHNNGFGPSTHSSRTEEINALEMLRERLLQVANEYYSVPTDPSLRKGSSTTLLEQSAAIIIHSELRTLHFFVQAADRVLHRLSLMDNASPQKRHKPTITETTSRIKITESDKVLLDTQIDELVQTYMQIRHYQVTGAE